ncbi:ABC-type transporter, periplasmic subunit family 3 [Gemmatirosa kalamazoonensis]|uniref:ABC-type transporter, periplasmic subunit family 3 n=1 Tax=Gemmatirosa kalamazoonensis TaxID=861299 RepID=W0RFV6_9BACT|nr:transporter substrate-binding domain-containing protein [Gemmatirosa kalamazoonensis]AHG88268.1 ABC-type transporter, periplasmic subunit family 3 [Gemmatirosa kalamazoonensis]
MDSKAFARALLACGALACSLPRDADGTLDRARHGTLRVGAFANPPWVIDTLGTLDGVEVRLVTDLARGLGARVTWIRKPEAELMEALHERELDLVVGGLTAAEPWAKQVAFTHPYHVDTVGVGVMPGAVTRTVVRQHVLAVAKGENAWLVHVERFLRARRPTIPAEMRSAGS